MKARTPGPWYTSTEFLHSVFADDRHATPLATCEYGIGEPDDEDRANAAFIVEACNAYDDLRSDVARLTATAEGLQRQLDVESDRLIGARNENARLREIASELVALAHECRDCDGTGREDKRSDEACHTCGGIGEIVNGGQLLYQARAALARKGESK